jgi:metallophosphoesterase (TIGR03767 family)
MKRLALVVVLVACATASASTTLDKRVVPGEPAPFTTLVDGPGDGIEVRADLAAAQPRRERRRTSLAYFAQLSDFQLADEESPARVEMLDQTNEAFSAAWRPQEALMPYVVDASVRQVNANDRSPIKQAGGKRAKLAFTLLTGDNADNQQTNEARWVDTLLDGGTLDPNSGHVDAAAMAGFGCGLGTQAALSAEAPNYTGVQDYDDYIENGTYWDPDKPLGQFATFPTYPGLLDRAQQPFEAAGLDAPSYVAVGNHDRLVQGNAAATAPLNSVATGCLKPLAPTFNPNDPGALLMDAMLNPSQSMVVPPDADRQFSTNAGYRAAFAGAGQSDAHGFANIDKAEADASLGAANYYAFSPRKGLRFIALDTVSVGGVIGPSADGNIDDPQFKWLEGELQAAEKADQLVVVFSHHAPVSLTADVPDEVAPSCDDPATPSNPGCDLDPRSSTPLHLGADMTELLLRHPHVIAWVAGHSHVNDVAFSKGDAGGFWIVRTSAEADFPHQDRLLELMDNHDGTLSLFGVLLDDAAPAVAPPPGTAAAELTPLQLASIARTLGFNDPQRNPKAIGEDEDRNVELLVADPRRAAAPAKGKLRVRVRPRRIVAGRRTTLKVRVTRGGRPVRGVRVRAAGKRKRTNARGRARLRVRVGRPGAIRVKARGRRIRVRVVRSGH